MIRPFKHTTLKSIIFKLRWYVIIKDDHNTCHRHPVTPSDICLPYTLHRESALGVHVCAIVTSQLGHSVVKTSSVVPKHWVYFRLKRSFKAIKSIKNPAGAWGKYLKTMWLAIIYVMSPLVTVQYIEQMYSRPFNIQSLNWQIFQLQTRFHL